MSRKNGFGALRLMLALLVILSHAPEMANGDRHREILTRLFGTLSFGDLAVDGFFIISGYLISASMLSNSKGFLRRRVMRIYPGFLVASLFCLVIVGPLRGISLTSLPRANGAWL
ncbi:acyltransferase family protein [Novosphingobium sp. KACC 22771]|uniref:acyltransferase family protein n=1 Tax=Novosphingobium sp. KACC 22771 TaxID=3025670 RepID=UPI002367391E|nr:acyltransferase family protein [Novosphingobium sp. KACC 22771]WDF74671.1 acyltransferase family protein [Novosphingobium sp. KACC 22771]